jgi:hypothetical protein
VHQKKCTQFGFCCGSSNKLEDGASDMNGPIEFNQVSIVWDAAQEKVTTGMATCFWCREAICIRVNIDNHVRGTEEEQY